MIRRRSVVSGDRPWSVSGFLIPTVLDASFCSRIVLIIVLEISDGKIPVSVTSLNDLTGTREAVTGNGGYTRRSRRSIPKRGVDASTLASAAGGASDAKPIKTSPLPSGSMAHMRRTRCPKLPNNVA